jgi:hypothetical protein
MQQPRVQLKIQASIMFKNAMKYNQRDIMNRK